MEPFFVQRNVPVNSCLLVESAEAARRFPLGDIELGACGSCGMVSNLAFDPVLTEYSGRYEETQAFSPTFNRFQEALATDLVERLGLRGVTVVEIGCGKGEFLALLCRIGDNTGIGFDPSFDPTRKVGEGLRLHVHRQFFDEHSAGDIGDLVICKMTLEHIPETAAFARALRRALRTDTGARLFIQVPESLRILETCAFEDIYYEHCSYFSPGSLARLFRSVGISVERLERAYGAQYLTLEGSVEMISSVGNLPAEEPSGKVLQLARDFSSRCQRKIDEWRAVIRDRSAAGPIAVWGSGSKAVAFLHATRPESMAVEQVVDINPHRQGHYMPGTGQRIVAPAELAQLQPATVIIMNPVYRAEIAHELDKQRVAATVLAL